MIRSSHDLTLAAVDRDGALEEAFGSLQTEPRRDFLRRSVLGGAALLGAALTPTARAGGRTTDVAILNFALALEYLQDAFYTETERIGVLRGKLAEQARVVGGHERAHVVALRRALGRQAIGRPRFNFGGATETPDAFRRTAVAFEDLGTAAYKGQAPRIESREYLAAAVAIHSVEARHAAWIRRLAGVEPAATAFDQPVTQERAQQIVASTRFVVSTSSHQLPTYTG
jgi:Ferritin-like domain